MYWMPASAGMTMHFVSLPVTMKDFIVFDIETKNTLAEVGRDNFDDLQVSVVGLFSYAQNKYLSFDESELDLCSDLLRDACIIGFSITRFDIPVLNKHCKFNLFSVPRIDLLDDIELQLGRRISLDLLAKLNLGIGKTHHSLEAPAMYREGRLEELAEYCLHDVRITKELYELARLQGHLLVPQWGSDEPERATFNFGSF